MRKDALDLCNELSASKFLAQGKDCWHFCSINPPLPSANRQPVNTSDFPTATANGTQVSNYTAVDPLLQKAGSLTLHRNASTAGSHGRIVTWLEAMRRVDEARCASLTSLSLGPMHCPFAHGLLFTFFRQQAMRAGLSMVCWLQKTPSEQKKKSERSTSFPTSTLQTCKNPNEGCCC